MRILWVKTELLHPVDKGGKMLKKIGTRARVNIETMLGARIFLELFVKVQPGWRNSRAFVDELDWRRQLENLSGLSVGRGSDERES